MSYKTKQVREDMLREWDDEFSQEDREAVAAVLLRSEVFLHGVLQTSIDGGLQAHATEVTREIRLTKLARQILAFDSEVEEQPSEVEEQPYCVWCGKGWRETEAKP